MITSCRFEKKEKKDTNSRNVKQRNLNWKNGKMEKCYNASVMKRKVSSKIQRSDHWQLQIKSRVGLKNEKNRREKRRINVK